VDHTLEIAPLPLHAIGHGSGVPLQHIGVCAGHAHECLELGASTLDTEWVALEQAQQLAGITGVTHADLRTPAICGGLRQRVAGEIEVGHPLPSCRDESEPAIQAPRRREEQGQLRTGLARLLQAALDHPRGVSATPPVAAGSDQSDSHREEALGTRAQPERTPGGMGCKLPILLQDQAARPIGGPREKRELRQEARGPIELAVQKYRYM
jgi:hypothetical protein